MGAFAMFLVPVIGCSSTGGSVATTNAPPPSTAASNVVADDPPAPLLGLGPGFPDSGPWLSFYGAASAMGDLARVASKYRILNIDADPDAKNFTAAQIETLKANGKNRVLSYLNVGSCERHRSYWSSCAANARAQLGPYDGYEDETWMDPSDEQYQRLIVDHVAARLAVRGVDGFYLDNLELLGHGATDANGPCNARCRQGGLDLVYRLRERYPDLLIVMQNGTSDVTRLGKTHGIDFPRVLDGIAHEEVYAPSYDGVAERELLAWQAMKLRSRTGRPFWIAVEDYAGSCRATTIAKAAAAKAEAHGFSSYVSDTSAGQQVVCHWP